MEIELLLGMSLIANRAAEFVKRRMKATKYASYAGDAASGSALLVGAILTVGGDVNIFAEYATGMSDTIGQIASGLVVGGGSEAVHLLFDLFYNRKKVTTAEIAIAPDALSATIAEQVDQRLADTLNKVA